MRYLIIAFFLYRAFYQIQNTPEIILQLKHIIDSFTVAFLNCLDIVLPPFLSGTCYSFQQMQLLVTSLTILLFLLDVNLNFVSLQMFFYRVCLKLLDLRYLKSFLEIIFVNFIERIE